MHNVDLRQKAALTKRISLIYFAPLQLHSQRKFNLQILLQQLKTEYKQGHVLGPLNEIYLQLTSRLDAASVQLQINIHPQIIKHLRCIMFINLTFDQ